MDDHEIHALLTTMTDQDLLRLLEKLNDRCKLVIQDPPHDHMEPFYIVAEVGYHASTREIVFLRGDEVWGDDGEMRERVQWTDPTQGSPVQDEAMPRFGTSTAHRSSRHAMRPNGRIAAATRRRFP
jgi:hypothetical protein